MKRSRTRTTQRVNCPAEPVSRTMTIVTHEQFCAIQETEPRAMFQVYD